MGRRLCMIALSLFSAFGCTRSGEPVHFSFTEQTASEPVTPAVPRSAADREAEDFFEQKVRPVLVEHCVACHGPQKQRGGLRLDSARALQRGSDAGPVVVAGDPDKSVLIQAIRHEGTVKMPPKAKLPEAALAALTTWVKQGARWPAETGTVTQPPDKISAASQRHWAFQPVQQPAVPQVQNKAWGLTPLDAFILARLEAARLKPSPAADRRTLIRRATFDLHGLPPTPEEVAAFEADRAPDAFARVVNRLLDSPRYGERWGRHWLDVARYADTKGYVRLKENPHYLCSWTYRDYVIRAFNDDLPYDQFIMQQLAADQLPLGDDKRPLAALGFLTLGERFINNPHDIIDDRIDVVTRGLLGLTVSCARCHDHKFDPIPTQDYYSLYGVFAGSLEPRVPPLIVLPSEQAKHAAYLKELQARTARFEQFLQEQYLKLTTSFRRRAADYLLAAQKETVQPHFVPVMFLIDASKDLNPVLLQRWAKFLAQTRKQHHAVLAPWHALAALPPADFAAKLPELLAAWRAAPDPSKPINTLVLDMLAREPRPRDLVETAARYGELFAASETRWAAAQQKDPAVKRLDDPAWEAIRALVSGVDAPAQFPLAEIEDYFFVDATTQNLYHDQQRHVVDWIGSPNAAPHALTLVDAPVIPTAHVFVRGNPSNLGPVVPRQFLQRLSRGERKPFQHGSGRLELAQAIANKDNPLTARVLVNRVWMHHFGTGLVRIPGDFGLRGEAPTHPELLDYLAARFMTEGWSLKKLHRAILLSAVYQQQSQDDRQAREKDPDNTLLWRMNRRRLDWEALRDALLAVAGNLDATRGGPGVSLTSEPFATRRSVYGFVDRQNLPSVLRTFDFASPDVSNPQRHNTTVPQQALFLLNSPFLKEQVRHLAKRPELLRQEKIEARISALYRLLYGRVVEVEELALGVKFLGSAPSKASDPSEKWLSVWEEYVQVLLLANEFHFID